MKNVFCFTLSIHAASYMILEVRDVRLSCIWYAHNIGSGKIVFYFSGKFVFTNI